MGPSPELLLQMIEQNDQKQTDAHHRLRRALTDGFAAMARELEKLQSDHREDHDVITVLRETGELRKEISTRRAIVLAATISGGFQVLVVILGWISHLFGI